MIWAFLLAWAISWIPKRVVAVSLIFLLGFACGQVTAYRVLVHADRPTTMAKEQRHSRQRFVAKKGTGAEQRSPKQEEPESPPHPWYLPVAGS